ncbi:MAG: type VI secretion system-associated protein TagF [Alphaproteobacteria bacterium]
MSEPVIGPPSGSVLHGASVGFCGKLPARGDFVSVGLPRSFVEEWHDWMQRMLAASRAALGKEWLALWNVAPIWRFALPPGICGPEAVLGLWMPSIDRIGRQFPLTFASVMADTGLARMIRDGDGFLALAEAAGLDALAADLDPGDIAARLAGDIASTQPAAGIAPEFRVCDGALWWSNVGNSAAIGAVAFATPGLPDAEAFIRMLQPGKSVGGAECPNPS